MEAQRRRKAFYKPLSFEVKSKRVLVAAVELGKAGELTSQLRGRKAGVSSWQETLESPSRGTATMKSYWCTLQPVRGLRRQFAPTWDLSGTYNSSLLCHMLCVPTPQTPSIRRTGMYTGLTLT